ncbi:MAG: ABC transporter substrate-binding protein [Spirochaetales bacterium]|nr:ABC transporter substrate-binding protein [Spirochaetales bacterium]MCF7938291.1 ABC transporter substrate-binding protein [Spirochaetales bacterium]
MNYTTRPNGIAAAFGLAVLASLVLGSCADDSVPIRIGVNDWPPCEVWYVAEEQGFFDDVEVEFVRYSVWRDNMSNFYKGKTDISHATYFNALYYHGKGEQAKITLTADTVLGSDGLVVRKGFRIPENLPGSRIAVEVNTDEHFLLNKMLQEHEVEEEELQIVPATSKGAMELFVAGEVDGCFTYDPYLSQAAEQGEGTIVWTTADAPGYMEDVLVVRSTSLRERERDIYTVFEAWYEALAYIREYPEYACPLMAENEGLSEDEFTPFFESFHFYSIEENAQIFASRGFIERLEEMKIFIEDHGSSIEDIDLEDVYTEQVVRRLME